MSSADIINHKKNVLRNVTAFLIPAAVFAAIMLAYYMCRRSIIELIYRGEFPFSYLTACMANRGRMSIAEYVSSLDGVFESWVFTLTLLCFMMFVFTFRNRLKACSEVWPALVLGLFTVYIGVLIWRTSFMVQGVRYFSLFDDAMISMRYARNLAEGYGLVWNPGGDRIEGFTNPLWTFAMALIHLVPIPPSKISLCVQAFGAVLMGLTVWMSWKVAQTLSSGNCIASISCMILTAFYYPLINWSAQGMEVSALALIVMTFLYREVESLKTGRPVGVGSYLLAGIGTFVRLDAIILVLALVVWDVFVLRDRHRRAFLGTLCVIAMFVMQFSARYYYYDEFWPNTYFLKMTGYPCLLRWSRGAFSFCDFAMQSGVFWLVLCFLFLYSKRERGLALVGLLICMQIAYSVYAGGDAWEWFGGSNRYVSIVMPAVFVIAGLVLAKFAKWIEGGAAGVISRAKQGMTIPICLMIFLAQINCFHGTQTLFYSLLVWPPLHVEDNLKQVQNALQIREITHPTAKIGVVMAGCLPYFVDRACIDFLGKNDKLIARERAHQMKSGTAVLWEFYPGHMKWDYSYSIGKLRPDVIMDTWYADYPLSSYAYDASFGGYLLSGSTNILWGKTLCR